ncbi:hypothetical protein [uncultured Methanobrevibacter sp.]|uniref:hypothetical protein n=1 Tax=uncultured Methanobrevibacter sp. TaxID=253161 RepID=UPI00262F2485
MLLLTVGALFFMLIASVSASDVDDFTINQNNNDLVLEDSVSGGSSGVDDSDDGSVSGGSSGLDGSSADNSEGSSNLTDNSSVLPSKKDTSISSQEISFVYGTDAQANINLKDSDGLPLSGKILSLTLNGQVYNLSTDDGGLAIFNISNPLAVANYNLLIDFAGDENYNPSNASVDVKITKASTKLYVPKVRSYLTVASYVNVSLMDSNGALLSNKDVLLTVSGKTYNASTNSKGIARIKIPNAVGTFTCTAEFKGDGNYSSSKKSSKITITKMKTILSAPAVSSYMTKNTYLKVNLKNIYGTALKNKAIYVTYSKKTYKIITNASGVAKLKFAKKVGTYSCIVKFKATSNFYANSTSVKVKISKMPTLVSASKITINSTKYGSVLITLKDKQGNLLKNKTVSVSIPSANKTYSVKTNSSGIAVFKFNGPKTYNLSLKFAATKYYSASSNTTKCVVKPFKVAFNDVVKMSKLFKNYLSANKSLPSNIVYKNVSYNTAQLSYLMAVAIKHVANKNYNNITLIAVSAPSSSSGEIYDTVYKENYLKIVNKAVGSSIKHKTYSYISYSIYKVPYKVYTAEFSRILSFYGDNKKLPNYSLFTNSEFTKVSNSSKLTFYLTTDNIAGKKSDLKMLKSLASTLKSMGYNAIIIGIGPDIHNVAYRYGCTGNNSVLLAVFGGVDVGCIEEWSGEIGSLNGYSFVSNYKGAHVLGLWFTKPYGAASSIYSKVGRAWDADYGHALANPAKYMASNNISYIQTGTVASACKLLKAGKMGGPQLIS